MGISNGMLQQIPALQAAGSGISPGSRSSALQRKTAAFKCWNGSRCLSLPVSISVYSLSTTLASRALAQLALMALLFPVPSDPLALADPAMLGTM